MLNTIITFLEQSIELFKKNYNLFLSLSVVSGLIAFFYQTFQNYAFSQNESIGKVLLVIFSVVFLIFGFIYYGSRINISLFLLINDKIKSKETSISKVFDESKNLFWTYFKTTVKLGLLLMIPIILFMIALLPEINIFIKAILVITPVIAILYIVLNYGLAINVSILEPDEISYFTKSKELFEINKKMVVLLFLIVIGLSALASHMPFWIFGNAYIFNIIDRNLFLSTILTVFISPILSGFSIYTYWYLNSRIESNKNEQEGNALGIDGSEM